MSGVMHPPESIYNLIPKEEVIPEKPPRYMSKFRVQVKLEKQQNKSTNKTMGPARVEPPSPKQYLQKHSREARLPEKKPFSYGDGQPRKPQVPDRTERPPAASHTPKDFLRSNVVENVMSVPHKPPPAYAHTKHGDKELLENSGLVPKYVRKEDYGQSPEYLKKRQEEVRRAQERYDQYVIEQMKAGAMKQLTEEEHQDVLHGLKKNWDQLQHQYQGLSLITDTISKKQKKQRLETEIKQLEKDIELIERYTTIYIANH